MYLFKLITICCAVLHDPVGRTTSGKTVNEVIGADLTVLAEAIEQLDQAAEGYKRNQLETERLQAGLAKVRSSFKKVEFLSAYRYPEFVSEHINGAPLLHIEKETSKATVIEPEGLQVLDELVYSEEVYEERVKIASLTKKLHNNLRLIIPEILREIPTSQQLLEAMRLELVRVFTLGVTGFDTPGSLDGIIESSYALEGMKEVLEGMSLDQEGEKQELLKLFDKAINTLRQGSFVSFDRLRFLKECIDPLYQGLLALYPDALPSRPGDEDAWNPASRHIFSDAFLNPYHYTQLRREKDSEELRKLGKVLFYDPILSSNGQMSCASCHQPSLAFSDGILRSHSNVEGQTVLRNAPTLVNAVYADRFFYDLRAFTLEQQVEHVIFNPEEFNTAYEAIIQKLEENPKYAKLFRKGFGTGRITRERFSKALASYVLSLRSFNSPFDRYVRGEKNEISAQAMEGFNLFMGKANCGTCHFPPTFSGLVPPLYRENESEILGVLSQPGKKALDNDPGRWNNEVYSEQAWIYERSFKTSTVRNAALTSPYFHHGAYKTLEEVIDFYNEGGGTGVGLNVKNQTLSGDKLDLTDHEKKAIIAFIRSLNDVPETGND